MVLGILFFLPVTFLLFLYPATHNYTPLDIVKDDVLDLKNFKNGNNETISLADHITILGFIGFDPKEQTTAVSNLKELVYDKFKGFKRFQIVMLAPIGTENQIEALLADISSYEDLKFWHVVFGEPETINKVFRSLKSQSALGDNLSSDLVYVIDKDLSQRGRLDDRTDREMEKNKPIYGLYGYNGIEVSEIKNKMSDDLRILFTEYRQKRKGEFNTDVRRANDLKNTDETN